MNIPGFQTFLRPVLETLSGGKSYARRDLIQETLAKFSFTQEELSLRYGQGGALVLADKVGWALVYLKQAGLVESPARAQFHISEAGETALRSGEQINRTYLYKFESFRQFMDRCRGGSTQTSVSSTNTDNDTEDPKEQISEACLALNAALKGELLETLLNLKDSAFERFCVDLLVKMGYGNPTFSRVTQASADGGIDGIVTSDCLGFDKVYIQAKRYCADNTVGSDIMRDFIGALDNYESNGRGVFITTSKFTKGAVEKAQGSKHHKIMLIDGDKLTDLMIEHGVGVMTTEVYTLKGIDSAFYDAYETINK